MRKIKQKIIHRKSGWEILPIFTFLCCTCLLQLFIFLLLSFRFSSFVILFRLFLSFFFPIDFAFPQTFLDTHPADFAFSSYFPCSFRTFHTLTLNKTRSLSLSPSQFPSSRVSIARLISVAGFGFSRSNYRSPLSLSRRGRYNLVDFPTALENRRLPPSPMRSAGADRVVVVVVVAVGLAGSSIIRSWLNGAEFGRSSGRPRKLAINNPRLPSICETLSERKNTRTHTHDAERRRRRRGTTFFLLFLLFSL